MRNRISPIQMNSGSAVSVQFALPPQIDVAITAPAGALVPTQKVTRPGADQREPDPQTAAKQESHREQRDDRDDREIHEGPWSAGGLGGL